MGMDNKIWVSNTINRWGTQSTDRGDQSHKQQGTRDALGTAATGSPGGISEDVQKYCENDVRLPRWGQTGIYWELGSLPHHLHLPETQRQVGMRKLYIKIGFRHALIGHFWHGGAEERLTRGGASSMIGLGSILHFFWLVLSRKQSRDKKNWKLNWQFLSWSNSELCAPISVEVGVWLPGWFLELWPRVPLFMVWPLSDRLLRLSDGRVSEQVYGE